MIETDRKRENWKHDTQTRAKGMTMIERERKLEA